MDFRIRNVYVRNIATTSLRIHIFGVAAGMRNSTTMRFNLFIILLLLFLLLSSLFLIICSKLLHGASFLLKKNFLDALSLLKFKL